jgi:hypothetical protein
LCSSTSYSKEFESNTKFSIAECLEDAKLLKCDGLVALISQVH